MKKEIALRDNASKPELSYWLMFPHSAEAFARVMEYGASKYAKGNYAKGGKPDAEYLDALARHLTKMMQYYHTNNKEDLYDKESGCLHMGHILFNLFCWLDLNHKDLELKLEQQK